MTQFFVADMTCGHCASTITRALKAEDSNAQVEIDVKAHLVKVASSLPASELAAAIREAGYTPQPR